ncbi:hypothetical protein [Lutibacter maritimus]|uniref:Uncharacterized protein n=1 Tax=Lutibacter maritimus TaxID=593133 RepID=A0A1I6NS95_9FLAO|nr:hypothetical protein [Lutibacter maritimus]SFS30740.1 hypothetical protein SAMN04488006_0479 [Lutibacter maritimus]
MSKTRNIIADAEKYINKHNVPCTVEELFIEFERKYRLHIEFEAYLKQENINSKLEKMRRDKRLLEKRKLFAEWYFVKNQATQSVKKSFINISEMVFASTKTVQNDILKETTD